MSSSEIYERHLLDVEPSYRAEGWEVEYDKPGYNETYEATFTFRKKYMKTEFETSHPWHNTRPHSEECIDERRARAHAEGRRVLYAGPCRIVSCPHGQPWPTFRINPADPPFVRELHSAIFHPSLHESFS